MSVQDLPEINFVEVNPDQVVNDLINDYESVSGTKLYPADPVRLFLLSVAQLIIQQQTLINLTAKSNLLRYASGDILDHLGAMVETARVPAVSATAVARFTISTVRLTDLTIPSGTRITPGSELYFATLTDAVIPAGSLYVDTTVQCLQAGTVGNGFIAGQINAIVDPYPYYDTVSNLTTSSGGVEEEEDERYRERVHTAPESFSTAGPTGAYEFWAKSADISIIDVVVTSPTDGNVQIRPLLAGGAIPDASMLTKVSNACNARTVRPLTDNVTVLAPTVVNYTVTYTYYIAVEDAANESAIQTAVTQAAADFVLWQKSKLGRDINPSELIARLVNAGAKRVTVTLPAYTAVNATSVAISTSTTGTYGGLE